MTKENQHWGYPARFKEHFPISVIRQMRVAVDKMPATIRRLNDVAAPITLLQNWDPRDEEISVRGVVVAARTEPPSIESVLSACED
jgi:hypothetical protein